MNLLFINASLYPSLDFIILNNHKAILRDVKLRSTSCRAAGNPQTSQKALAIAVHHAVLDGFGDVRRADVVLSRIFSELSPSEVETMS
jgi:NRPS condensation-like uncharacterized protein